jgi:isopentenyl-diphosphate Delta-isomerase
MSAPTSTSLIDRVDDDDRPVDLVPRADALRTGANFRTAHVFLRDWDGGVLVQRLAPYRERHPGRWGSSVAAYLYAGETYEQAAERRLREELGVQTRLMWLGKIRMRDGESTKFVGLFVGRDDLQPRIVEPDHIAEIRYWSLAELDVETRAAPERFTPTFLQLYPVFRDAVR